MSYASGIKAAISEQISESRPQQRAELSALVRSCGTLHIRGGGELALSVQTENQAVAKLIVTLFQKIYQKKVALHSKAQTSLNKRTVYEIIVDDVRANLVELGIVADERSFQLLDDVPDFVFSDNANRRAYIRGMFLGSGSINDPAKSYHLEFVVTSKYFAERFMQLLKAFDLYAKMLERKSHFIVYIKDSDQIVDILNIIGAHSYLLSYESTRVAKAMKNYVNRIVNCDTANVRKMMAASNQHIEAIETIDRIMGLKELPESLYQIAQLRLENQEITLAELGELLTPPISKSGANHRMKKLIKLADKLKAERGLNNSS
ncbi:MAG: DNA-binding protein WhiA [Clostridiales bacterium]|nr:MAG: DNA-binding protein WhiA [Clostridiales bacterium]